MLRDNPTKPPVICYMPTGTVHFVQNASGDPCDGSPHGLYTYCGRQLDLEKQPGTWFEIAGGATCRTCTQSEAIGRDYRERVYYRSLADELLAACEELVTAMTQLGKEHHREVVAAQIAIAKAKGA